MKERFLFLVKFYTFWLVLFLTGKLVFLLYQYNQSFHISPGTWINIFLHGFRLDLSTAGYFSLIPAFILIITSFSRYKLPYYILNTYTFIALLIFLLITLIDMEAYKYWGTRLDNAPLRFMGKPKEMLASSTIITLVLYTLSFIVLSGVIFWVYLKYVAGSLKKSPIPGWKGLPVFLCILAFLVLPIRGGFGVSPLNTGSVYFSKTAFANHSAINVIWNFGQSLLESKESHNPYVFDKKPGYQKPLLQLYESGARTVPVINNKRPYILLIVLESFSAKLIEPLGGVQWVTPEFNRLCRDGVLFSGIYSTDSRTDKGVATIISGYPVLDAIPIMKYPEKTQHLPFLSKSLESAGYLSDFIYGGDVDFGNMRSYLVNGGFNRITSEFDFPASLRTGKWGVPDQYVYDYLLKEIKADTGRRFQVMLSLTNHEPFEIPAHPKFGDKNLIDKFYSAAFYADSCLGDFIRKFKETRLWDNTLIIMIADHGTRLPEFDDIFEPRKHHIPMLWTGGAVTKDTVVSKIGSQADLAFTLLRQLELDTDDYILGKDLLSPSSRSFAFYSIKEGIAMLTDTSGFGFDFISDDFSYTYGKMDSSHANIAKALQQYVFENYLNLSRGKQDHR